MGLPLPPVKSYLSDGRHDDRRAGINDEHEGNDPGGGEQSAQAHGYNGLNFRELATKVGIKPASIYHHFPSKADLGAAVARRYWEDTAAALDAISSETSDPKAALRRFPEGFRDSLERDNRLCMGSFMSAEYDDLPEPVMKEVQTFADINVAWLSQAAPACRHGRFRGKRGSGAGDFRRRRRRTTYGTKPFRH